MLTIPHRLALFVLALLVIGCDIPRDIEGTTDEVVRRGTIRAGVVAGADTVRFTDSVPTGAEIGAVEGFAEELGVGIDWRVDSEHELIRSVQHHELDIVVGGIERQSPWSARVALSVPITGSGDEALVAVLPKGENEWLLRWERHLEREASD